MHDQLLHKNAVGGFWAATWSGSSAPKQNKLAVFQYVMNTTPHPTNPSRAIGTVYVAYPEELDESEPRLLVETIEAIDPDFFDDYPRPDATKPMDMDDKCAVVEDAVVGFYRHGIPWKSRALPGM